MIVSLLPRYTAPEVFARFRVRDFNCPPHIERKGDVYSFGMILYEILNLSPPWGDDSAEAIEGKVRGNERPPLPDARDSPVRVLLRDLIVKTWDQNPSVRPEFEEIVLFLRPLEDFYLADT